jgi:hypothetical protein
MTISKTSKGTKTAATSCPLVSPDPPEKTGAAVWVSVADVAEVADVADVLGESEELVKGAEMTLMLKDWVSEAPVNFEVARSIIWILDGCAVEGTRPERLYVEGSSDIQEVSGENIAMRTVSPGFCNSELRLYKNGEPIVIFKDGMTPENNFGAMLIKTCALATSPKTSVTVTEIFRDVAFVGGVPVNVKVELSNFSQLGRCTMMVEMLELSATLPSSSNVLRKLVALIGCSAVALISR